MTHASRFRQDVTPQALAQEFLNQRVIDLPGITEKDLEYVLEENRDINGLFMEPRPDIADDMYGNTRKWLVLDDPNPTSMTVRQYMHFSANADFYDLYKCESTREEARKTHGETYQEYIDNTDEERFAERKIIQPLRRYLALLDRLCELADKGTQQRLPIASATLRDGLEAISDTAQQMHEWSDRHLQEAASASSLEMHFYNSKGWQLLEIIGKDTPYPDWVTSQLQERLPRQDIQAKITEMEQSDDLIVRNALNREALAMIHEAMEDALPVDYRQVANEQMEAARPIDAAARIQEKLHDQIEELATAMGISLRKREKQ